jgi:hypothetical protein
MTLISGYVGVVLAPPSLLSSPLITPTQQHNSSAMITDKKNIDGRSMALSSSTQGTTSHCPDARDEELGFAVDKEAASPAAKSRLTVKNQHHRQTPSSSLLPLHPEPDGAVTDNDTGSTRSVGRKPLQCILIMILVLGVGTSLALLWIGIRAENETVADDFTRSAVDLVNKIENAWEDYVAAAASIHGQCRHEVTRRSFRQVYEYLKASGLDVQAAQWDPRVVHDQRATYEAEARNYYAEKHPHVNYRGFVGFNTANATSLEPRDVADVYYPIRTYSSIALLYRFLLAYISVRVYLKQNKFGTYSHTHTQFLSFAFAGTLWYQRLYGTN